MSVIKESRDLKTLDITTLFGKLIEHAHELKRLEAREVNAKKKEKLREEKRSISLKAFASKAKVKEDDKSTSHDDSSKEEYMNWFVKRYNNHVNQIILKHSNKNLINFKNSHSSKNT